MNLKEIKALNNEELVAAFYWVAVSLTNEVNSRRGLTKGTQKQEKWLMNEIIKRFDLDAESFEKMIIK
jgi:hypothetical protein